MKVDNCVLIVWIVRVFWLVNKFVFIAQWSTKMKWTIFLVGYLQVVRIYNFMKEIKVYIRASYIVFLLLPTDEKKIIKVINHVLFVSIAWWKPRQSLWEFSSGWKPSTSTVSRVSLICFRILPNVRLEFHQTMLAQRQCFIS